MAVEKQATPEVAPTNAHKRPRLEFEADAANGSSTPLHLHESLTPRCTSRCGTPDSGLQLYDDDCHDEYEWVRLPKKRNFDLFQAARLEPEDRNHAQVPLTAVRHDGKDVTMWAKMDTGGGANSINRSTVEALFGAKAKSKMRAMTAEEEIHLLPGTQDLEVTHSITVDFVAGKSKTHFEKVSFLVLADEPEKSSQDGVPNVILGYQFLKDNNMLMIDLDYCNDADPELDVIADKAENENGNATSILPYAAQVRGLPPKAGAVRQVRGHRW